MSQQCEALENICEPLFDFSPLKFFHHEIPKNCDRREWKLWIEMEGFEVFRAFLALAVTFVWKNLEFLGILEFSTYFIHLVFRSLAHNLKKSFNGNTSNFSPIFLHFPNFLVIYNIKIFSCSYWKPIRSKQRSTNQKFWLKKIF